MRIAVLLFVSVQLAGAETFIVVHQKDLWWDGAGSLTIDAEGVRFEAAEKQKFSRSWKWTDIQYADRLSETQIEFLTHEDENRYLGRDRSYRFTLTEGRISDDLLGRIAGWLGRPMTDRVVRETPGAGYLVPVKHLHAFGGCEGTLRFTRDAIQFETEHKKDARRWVLDRDVDSVWSANPYNLQIHAYDNNRREFSRTRVYEFDLKESLNPRFYHDLKLHLYRLERDAMQGDEGTAPRAE